MADESLAPFHRNRKRLPWKQRQHESSSKANQQLVKMKQPSSSGGTDLRISSPNILTRNGIEVATQLEDLKALEAAKRAKEASLKLAESRLENRLSRPGNENGDDAAQHGLRGEVSTLNQSIEVLEEQIDKGR
ncbi:unnamed protein product [Protopolystoma xenopodis]|uniref:Tektin n=1 Tax=Protopolystoma xenopodis TaxID=117903 RepID=A0A3S5A1N0_9PLAT|nr:unnamed protein product [Protopolystoma xenopodis]